MGEPDQLPNFLPCVINYDDSEFVTIILKDCPTILQRVGNEGVEVGRDMETGDIISMSIPYELFPERPGAQIDGGDDG